MRLNICLGHAALERSHPYFWLEQSWFRWSFIEPLVVRPQRQLRERILRAGRRRAVDAERNARAGGNGRAIERRDAPIIRLNRLAIQNRNVRFR